MTLQYAVVVIHDEQGDNLVQITHEFRTMKIHFLVAFMEVEIARR